MAFSDRAAMSRLAAMERRSIASTSAAAVIAYHELRPPREGLTALPVWLRAAQRVAGSISGVLKTVLFTNSKAARDGGGIFSKVIHADLVALAGLGSPAPRAHE